MRSQAMRPSGASVPPKGWRPAGVSDITCAVTSNGTPEAGPSLPPMRMTSRAPTPASKARPVAMGSHKGDSAKPPTPRSSRRCSKRVESPAAPMPGLSAVSASTKGRPSGSLANTRSIAWSIDMKRGDSCSRCVHTAWPSSSASRSARGRSPSVATSTRVPTSGVSPQGKPWASDTLSTPGSRSMAFMRATRPAMGSAVVG